MNPIFLVFLLVCVFWISDSSAQIDWSHIKDAKRFGILSVEQQQRIGLVETGLKPRFPDGITCPVISSPFGSRFRYDGSWRTVNSNNGYHGGMDISLDVGTPLLAVADGKVIHIGTGGRLVGNVIWMQHSPKDTGFNVWTYTKYQHLDEIPNLQIGDRIKAGDVVAISGLTGTTGGRAFGSMGYPHLHMNVYVSPNKLYKVKGHKVKIKERYYIDPVSFYREKLDDSRKIREFIKKRKIINVGVKLQTGEYITYKIQKVWPVLCKKTN